MNWEQRCIRMSGTVLAFALALRLWTGGAFLPVGQALEAPEVASFLLYLQTGRVVRSISEESPPFFEPEPTAPAQAPFTAEDARYIQYTDNCGQNPDIAAALTEELSLDLSGKEPAVLILHSHTTESFTQTADRYEESSPYRTLDGGHNMIALGDIVAEKLEAAGISVLHDTELHDYPSYSDSYSLAAASTRDYLEAYPSLRLVLDLHRDAAESDSGQLVTRCTVGGEKSAQLMFVMGTDTRLKHPDWERNLSLACKLQVLLERENPGICRKMNLSKNRYNQHLGDYALLIEIGAAGNTLDQAKIAAGALGDALVSLLKP